MRRALTTKMTMAMILLAGALMSDAFSAPPPKAQPKPDVGPGRVAWFDITTTNMTQSKEFYGKLFDWTFNSMPETDLAVQIVSRGTEIGTIRRAEGAISGFNGVVYIQVPDIRAACTKAQGLGAKLIPGFPFNLSDGKGAVGLVIDPSGHPMGLYSQTPLPPEPAPAK